ncbi:MAG: aminopeptidase P family protein [Phycisphaeraceae bacterium]|nr:aminopeptidase P family protein [Phycisphaeraceae bacterium]
MPTATLFAGTPETNQALYRRIRFSVGDPTTLVEVEGAGSTLIIRDIEMERARRMARADRVACPKDFEPPGGLSADRQTATAQATAECLRRAGVARVRGHGSTPLIYVDHIRRAGIEVEFDPDLGLLAQRQKDGQELAWLREAQSVTEQAMRMACELIASARAGRDGALQFEGAPLTSERVRSEIDVFLLRSGYLNPICIVAGGPQGGDCHERGTGPLRTGEPIIIDIYPKNRQSHYWGDCTRTVVHGEVPEAIAAMHRAVVEAKRAAIHATRAGVTADAVHAAAAEVIQRHGFEMGLPGPGDRSAHMTHGTGHGVGLDVHEPPLLDSGGPELLAGDVLTIEPGLYAVGLGGVRVEDMVAVTRAGCENFNSLPEGLTWT